MRCPLIFADANPGVFPNQGKRLLSNAEEGRDRLAVTGLAAVGNKKGQTLWPALSCR
jgi:hypothetical protein